MAQAGTIKNFIVALGFQTDNSGLAKMVGAMQGVEIKAKSLHRALGALAVGAVLAVRQTASELDKLYFSSKRIGASAENINAYGNAISQMGGSAEQAIGTLESLAEKMRNSPGYEGMLNSLGVSTKQANGAVRDRVEVMKDLSSVLAKMPQYQANAYADSLGIDQNTLLAMRDGKFISNMEKYQKLQKDMGMNDDLTKSGNDFMTEYRDLTMMTKTGFQVIVMQTGKALIPILRLLNQMVRAGITAFSQLNPQIKDTVTTGLRFMLLASVFSVFIRFFGVVFRFLPTLKNFISLMKILRLTFLASPLGIIGALITALGLLWDDYQTWKEGGKSLIDWGAWSKEIDYVIAKIQELMEWIENLGKKVIDGVFGGGTHQKLVDKVEEHVIEPIAGWFGGPTPMLDDKRRREAEAQKPKMIDVTPSTTSNALPKPNLTAQDIKQVVGQAQTLVIGLAQAVKTNVKEVASLGNDSTIQNYSSKNFTAEKAASIKETAKKIGVDPNHLAAVISFETGGTFNPSVKNPKSSATGLIQFMSGSGGTKGKYYGMSRDEFSSLSFEAQMKYVERYYKERGFSQGKQQTLGDVYGAVTGYGYKKGSKAYELNKVWDSNENGVIEKGEMVQNASFKKHQKDYFQNSTNTTSSSKNNNIKAQNLANFAQNAQIPLRQPYKTELRDNPITPNVTIHQEYKTDMTIHGAKDPQQSANAVKRQHESGNIILARNVQSVIP